MSAIFTFLPSAVIEVVAYSVSTTKLIPPH